MLAFYPTTSKHLFKLSYLAFNFSTSSKFVMQIVVLTESLSFTSCVNNCYNENYIVSLKKCEIMHIYNIFNCVLQICTIIIKASSINRMNVLIHSFMILMNAHSSSLYLAFWFTLIIVHLQFQIIILTSMVIRKMWHS
jgi:hypothetical protein